MNPAEGRITPSFLVVARVKAVKNEFIANPSPIFIFAVKMALADGWFYFNSPVE